MKTKTGVILFGVGTALLYAFRHSADAVQIKFEKLRMVRFAMSAMTFQLTLNIYNPFLFSVLVNEIVGDVYIMGIQVASINYPLNQRINAHKVNRFNILFDVLPTELTQALWANIQTGDIHTMLFRFDGYAVVRGVKIPVDRQFTFDEIFVR